MLYHKMRIITFTIPTSDFPPDAVTFQVEIRRAKSQSILLFAKYSQQKREENRRQAPWGKKIPFTLNMLLNLDQCLPNLTQCSKLKVCLVFAIQIPIIPIAHLAPQTAFI